MNSFTARIDVCIDITLLLQRFVAFAAVISSSTSSIDDSKLVVILSYPLNFEATMLSKRRTSPSLKLIFSARYRQRTKSI